MSSNSNETADAQYNKMINTPVRNLIFTLSVPTVISMLITMIYNMADTYFVSKISVSASGATGIVFGLMAIFQAFGFMFGQGSGSNIARRLGAKDLDGANQFCSTAFVVSLLTSVVISVICISFLDRLMRLLGSTDTILPYAKAYGIYIIIAGPAMTVGCVLNNILRYEGLAKLAMIGLTSGGILNILLDPLFIFTFKMGISGAGLATALSQYISVIILFMMFVLKKSQCCIKFKYVRMQFRFVWEIVATGFPSFIRNGLSSISTMVLNVMSSLYGDECIAAMSVANRCGMLIFSVCVGIGQGFQPVCAYNYGAKKFKRVNKSINFLWLYGTLVVLVFAGAMFFLAPSVISMFRDEKEVVEIGSVVLRPLCVSLAFLPTALTANMSFQSIGKKGRAFFLACCQNGLFFIPLVLVMPKLFGLTGLELSQPVAYVMAAVVSVPFLLAFKKHLKKYNGTD